MPCARPPVKEELPSSRNRHRLPLPSVFERQFDSAGHRNTLFPRHCSPMAISLSTVTETQLIAAFARFSGIRVKVSAGIHAVCLRVRGRLTLCLCGIRNDRNDTYRKASNQAHGNLPRAMGRRAILSKDRRLDYITAGSLVVGDRPVAIEAFITGFTGCGYCGGSQRPCRKTVNRWPNIGAALIRIKAWPPSSRYGVVGGPRTLLSPDLSGSPAVRHMPPLRRGHLPWSHLVGLNARRQRGCVCRSHPRFRTVALAAVFARGLRFWRHPREFAFVGKCLLGWAEDCPRAGCDQTI
jgi:hypothetical protein